MITIKARRSGAFQSFKMSKLSKSEGLASAAAASLEDLLGASGVRGDGRLRRLVIAAGLLLAALVAGFLVWRAVQTPETPAYRTELVTRGDLTVSVTATGTLAPLNQVQVGSELSGTVERVLVDDNDTVRRGQVLAILDTSRLADQIAVSEAALANAEANLRQARATERETRLKLDRLRRLWESSNGGYPARADVDAAEAAFERASAGAASARAAVRQAQANLRTNRTNLAKATIRSPISGVVLSRQVEPGQTVAASLQAPVLFTLAEDLGQMELHVDVDEAEVATVEAGQPATFTVDAYPNRTFRARLIRIGLGSQTKEGVVTYTGVLSVDNADLSLRPGMTATADISSRTRSGVLLVPETALRFTPPEAGDRQGGLSSVLTPRMPGIGSRRRGAADASSGQVWILRDGKPVRIPVRVGASNGRLAEVSGRGLSPGMAVIVSGDGERR